MTKDFLPHEYCYSAEARTTATGPNKPDGSRGELALYGFTSADVNLVAPGCSSPIRRLTQALTTLMVTSLAPGLSAVVASMR